MISPTRYRFSSLFLTVVGLTLTSPVSGQTEGDYLYRVTMVRAAPGHFTGLTDALDESFRLHAEAGDLAPYWIRHTQGDQWDFMLIYPMASFEAYYAPERTEQRRRVWGSDRGVALAARLEEATAFHEEWFARSVDVDQMAQRFDGMAMFHVEIMAGLPGKRAELVRQRRMENRYYDALGRQLNLIFVREAGANWDVMTLGFYESMTSYAEAGSRFSEAEQNEAARVAGFSGVGEISPYLRSLMAHHHDTLAVLMR